MSAHRPAHRRHARITSTKPLVLFAALVLVGGLAAAVTAATSASAHERLVGIYTSRERPSVTSTNDSRAVELGVRFSVTTPGSVVAIRFYKSRGNTGPHTGTLWTSSGQRVATVTFGHESRHGWQVAWLNHAVTLQPGRTYVASYHTTSGHYAQQPGAFAGGATIGNSTIRGTSGTYLAGAGFPKPTSQHSAYFVDVLFSPGRSGTPITEHPTPPPTTHSPTPTTPTTHPKPTPATSKPAPPTTSVPPTTQPTTSAPPTGAPPAGGEADACTTQLALPSAMPVAGNSGVPAGTRLVDSGGVNADKAGQIISGLQVTGTITVAADNVTIENSKVNSTGQYWAINVKAGVTGLKVIHNEIYTTTGGYEGIFDYSGVGMFACGNYLHNFENPMTIGDRAIIQSNYVDKMQAATGNCDDDGIEIYHGNHIRIWGNNIYAYGPDDHSIKCVNSALYTGDETNTPQNDIDINNNWIGGGLYTLRIDGSGPTHTVPVTNVQVRNNHWWYTAKTSGDGYGPVTVRLSGMISNWTNNTWMGDGTTLVNPHP